METWSEVLVWETEMREELDGWSGVQNGNRSNRTLGSDNTRGFCGHEKFRVTDAGFKLIT